ncbi:PKD domain-containing protein [Candidatus Binatia bacterium]|nr:PKD domain-containing protein [Candidatus Binatia bacterium]
MIGWLLADDFNAPYAGPAYNHPPSQVAPRRAELAALAPQHLGYASGGSYPGYRIAEYAGTMDLMGFQSYPLGAQNSPDEYALQENVDSFDWVRDRLAGTGQTFVANPQAYKWGGSRYPTPREARNLLYAPLLRGAKGVVWYTMWEGSDRYLPKTAPELWAALPALNREVATLAPFLLRGTRTELATGDARVHASRWELNGQTLVLAIGTQHDGPRTVSLALPAAATGLAQALFPDRAESGLAVSGGALSGNVGNEDVHAYLIDHAVPGDVSPSAWFTITPEPPVFGSPATLDGSSSSDPDGSVTSWEWDFGDGTRTTGAVVNHTWSTPGSYGVRLTVRDDAGAPGTTMVPVHVGVTALCPAAPLAGCRAASSTLSLRDPGSAARRTLTWTWKRGAASLAELGDPTAATEVALCIWDASGRVLATSSRPGTAWQSLGASGFRLRDPSGGVGGIFQSRLKPGRGTGASLTVKAKGSRLPAAALPLLPPVTVQLVTSDGGACWQGLYPAGGSTRSTATSFRGKD